MPAKRKREDDDDDFSPVSGKMSKAQKDEVTRSGRARKKPARFIDDAVDEDMEKDESDNEDDGELPPSKAPSAASNIQGKLLVQSIGQKQQLIPNVQQTLQIPASTLLQSMTPSQVQTVISPTGQQIKLVTPVQTQQFVQQVVPQVVPQVVNPQAVLPQAVLQSPPDTDAGKRGRVRKKSAKVLEMEEFEEAEKTKPKKAGAKQGSPTVTAPVQQSPVKQMPPTGITIVRNEQGQNVVLSVAGGVPGMVKVEQSVTPPKKAKGKGKVKEAMAVDAPEISPGVPVKTEPSEMMTGVIPPQAITLPVSGSSKKQKQVKTEPVVPNIQDSPPPTKKGKSVIKMLLNTPTQFTTPTVSTTAISSDKGSKKSPASPEKVKDIKKENIKSKVVVEPGKNGSGPVRKIIMSPSDVEDGSDEDEEDDDFDDDEEDDDEDDDDMDDDEETEWQFEHQDGTLVNPDELKKRVHEDSSPESKKGKKKAAKKKMVQDEDDGDDDDFGDDDEDDEGNLVIADEVKKKKTTKKSASKKKGDSKAGGKDKEKPEKKEKKKKRLTAYTMWCNSMRNKVLQDSPELDFAQLSKRLGEIWQGLPSRDKMSWKRKAKKEARKLLGKGLLIRTGKFAPPAPGSSRPPIHHLPPGQQKAAKQEEQAALLRIGMPLAMNDATRDGGSGIEPIDVAAYLKLVGESLSIIGMRLQEHRGMIAVQGSFSVLLDSLLCALGPLMCLTTQVPELHGCPAETHNRTLDNLAYFMPGL